MSELERALAELDRTPGWSGDPREIERVEVARDGAILFTTRDGEGFRWFRFDADELRELEPQLDSRVPLCATLDEGSRGRIVSWRPGRRVCLRAEPGGEPGFVKGYRRRRSGIAVRNHERVHAASWRAGSFSVPAVLGNDEATEAVHLAAVPGEPLAVSAGRSATYFRLGRALRLLQQDVDLEGLPAHGARDELEVLGTLAARTEPALADLPDDWRSTLERVAALEELEGDEVACHRDLHPGQLLHAPNAVGLLDFDLLCRAHPLLDLGNLTAHLRLRALQGLDGTTHADADDCALAVLEGYGTRPSGGERRALRFYQATTFLRLALIYSVRPRWADLAPQLSHLARRCLDG